MITKDWQRWYSPLRPEIIMPFIGRTTATTSSLQKGCAPTTVVALDRATTDVCWNACVTPLGRRAYQAKGLVVGFVQSGKTANITGVISTAIHAGYRLVIVMTGHHRASP